MTPDSNLSAWEGTKKDFQQSWKLLKANYRAFLGTELFAIGSFFLLTIIYGLILIIMEPNTAPEFSRRFIEESNYRWISLLVAYLILTIFINCQTGLAHDIMNSGDMYAEFKSSFTYFMKNWWKYILLSILTGSISLGIFIAPEMRPNSKIESDPDHNIPNLDLIMIIIVVLFLLIGLLWNALTMQSLASINVQPSFFRAIIESVRIFKSNPKRILSTWGLYYLIFVIPGFIFELVIMFLNPAIINPIIIILFVFGFNLFIIFIGLPLRALILTGLYINIKFKRFSPDPYVTTDSPKQT